MTRAPVLTRDGAWIADWPAVRDPAVVVNESEAAVLPLAQYLTQSPSAIHGVWLAPTDDLSDRYGDVKEWIRQCYRGGSVIYTACSGSILLAGTGLLDGREA